MTLRRPTLADASPLAAISIEVWLGTYLKRGVSAHFADYALTEFTPAKFSTLIRDPDQYILVSQNEEGIDGFIRVPATSNMPVAGDLGMEIATFYVQPRHQGHGIGRSLIDAALDHCRAQGAASAWLTTNSENEPAIAFYLQHGFEQVGETHFRIEDQGYLNNVYQYRFD